MNSNKDHRNTGAEPTAPDVISTGAEGGVEGSLTKKRRSFLLVFFLVLLLDRITKELSPLIPAGGIPLIPGVLGLRYAENRGAAFSILSSQTWILTVLSGAATALLLVLLLRRALPSRLGMLSLSLLLAGAAGNFIDRLAFGYVTDMFETTFMDFPVFNVADSYITVAAALLLGFSFFQKNAGKERADAERDSGAA